MAVNYPGNINDNDLTSSTKECDLNAPLDTPTGMSVFVQRMKLADLCRETIDTLPSILLEREEANYSSILALDAKYQTYIDNLPVFFRLDASSIQKSEDICAARPMLRHQRIAANLGIHVRIYRLHLPYYLRGRTNQIYARSNAACITSAQTVLELRRRMDEDTRQSPGPRPARLWKVAQHVFSAALVLAADVALDPAGLDATAKREQVLQAYRTLEESMRESAALREGVQRNLQTLMTTLRGMLAVDGFFQLCVMFRLRMGCPWSVLRRRQKPTGMRCGQNFLTSYRILIFKAGMRCWATLTLGCRDMRRRPLRLEFGGCREHR